MILVDKLYNGKGSLTEVYHALECTITPVAQKLPQTTYNPEWFTEIVVVSDVTQLFSRIYDTINFLRKICCCSNISTVAPLDGASTMCNNPSDDGEPEEDSTESFGEPPSCP